MYDSKRAAGAHWVPVPFVYRDFLEVRSHCTATTNLIHREMAWKQSIVQVMPQSWNLVR